MNKLIISTGVLGLLMAATPAIAQEREQTHQNHKQEQKQQKQQTRENKRQQSSQRRVEHDNRGRTGGNMSERNGRRIEETHFHERFGREHMFRPNIVVVDGYSRFNYGGYWFGFVEPWPIQWGYDNDVYVETEGDEYFLLNPRYPGVRVAVVIQ